MQIKGLKLSLSLWLAMKLLFARRSLFGGAAPFAFLGLSLGVAALVLSMAIFSGFESTLKNAVADVTGHVQVVKRSRFVDDWQELSAKIRQMEPETVATSRFVFVEAISARQGNIAGILVQGVDSENYKDVINYGSRVQEGRAELGLGVSQKPLALVGQRLAQKLKLKVGDVFKVVVPVASSGDEGSFHRRLGEFEVGAILDLGKYDWNERVVVTDLKATQEMAEIGDRYSGLFIRFQDIDRARESSLRLSQKLGAPYWVRDWRESNENLFDAVVYERVIIFFVVLILVVVAAFNVSSTLFVNVMQRYNDIAILKTLGTPPGLLVRVFALQGMAIGFAGFAFGSGLGWILCQMFMWAQSRFGLISGSVYKLDNIQVEIRLIDLSAILVATIIICFLATLAPARRGAKLSPVEGLRYG